MQCNAMHICIYAKESAKGCDLPFGFFCKLLGLDLSVVEVVL